jgi:hypothetical protein
MGMRDITDLMNSYRECCRNVFNVYFSKKENSSAALDRFADIERLLFDALVTDELTYGEENFEVDKAPASDLRVVPGPKTPILIERTSGSFEATSKGEIEETIVSGDEIELTLIDYFDWSMYPKREYEYFRCKILRFPNRTEHEGRRALIQVPRARVFDHEP